MTDKNQKEFDLNSFLPFELHQASEHLSSSFSQIYRDNFGMTRTEWRVFAHLGQSNPLTATQIGQSSKLHKTKVSRAITSLQKRGWVKRIESDEDRRIQSLHLTKTGQTTYQTLAQKALKFDQTVKARMGEEDFQMLLSLLQKLQN